MIYCLNPYCERPENPSLSRFCHHCGTQLALRDRYLAIKPLGEGGMGRTFLAEDRDRFGEPCVIKQFLPSADIQKSDRAMAKAIQLFEQEARRLIQLGHHPQIPILMSYFIVKNPSDRGTYPGLYLVQEWIDGQDLQQELFQGGAFYEAKIRQLLNKMLPVFQFIHQYNVIHRDIKPHNIMRRRSGELVLIDFGVAKELTNGAKTITGSKVGTEGYAAVEQLRGGEGISGK
jgi:serine/threonine protein kinase